MTLRALGSMQLAFADEHNGNFGNWQELTNEEYIQEGYSRANMIDNYSITVFERTRATLSDLAEDTAKPSFTIIAVPGNFRHKQTKSPVCIFPRRTFGINVVFRDLPDYYSYQSIHLCTFAISEDQTPLCWIGKSSEWTTENISLNNKNLWEPLR